jgi:integrase
MAAQATKKVADEHRAFFVERERTAMPSKTKRPKLPGVHTVKSRGKTYFYAFRGGPRLPDPDRDPMGFVKAYQTAHELKPATNLLSGDVRTVADLTVLYRDSGDFKRLAQSTQKLYRGVLNAIDIRFGDLALVALKSERMPAQIRKWRDQIADRPRAADTRVEVLASVLQWSVRYGHISQNPAHGIEGIHRANRSDIIWSSDELKRLLAAATPECARAITVAAYTGLRLGDLIGLTWDEVDFEAGVIERATNKSRGRTRAVPPLLPEARAALESAPKLGPTALTSGLKRPWTQSGLGNAFRDARDAIQINKRFHDLRGTAATRFATAGFSAQQIASFMGWEEGRVETILKRYLSRRKLAEDAAQRVREATESGD